MVAASVQVRAGAERGRQKGLLAGVASVKPGFCVGVKIYISVSVDMSLFIFFKKD